MRDEGSIALITSLKFFTLLVMPSHIICPNGFLSFGAKRGIGELGDWVILLWLLENWWKVVFCENLPTLTVAAVSTVILSITAQKSCFHISRLKINTSVHGTYSFTLLGTKFSFNVVVGVCLCVSWEQKFWPAPPGCPQATIPSPTPLVTFFQEVLSKDVAYC